MSELAIGSVVPQFQAVATGDKTIQLSDYEGHFLVLYFYPKDSTPGCTRESQAFRDHYQSFHALNTFILGVSRDSVRSHENFKLKHTLPFELLADQDEQLCQLFDVIKMKNLYGKHVRGIERSTFLINPDGVLIHQWRKVRVTNHCEAVLQQLTTHVTG
jgi:peroxiredoxin Q/BCP